MVRLGFKPQRSSSTNHRDSNGSNAVHRVSNGASPLQDATRGSNGSMPAQRDRASLVISSRDESGQAITEYLLLLSVVVSIFVILIKGITDFDFMGKVQKPLQGDFAKIYQYGHKDATGVEDKDNSKNPLKRIFYVRSKR